MNDEQPGLIPGLDWMGGNYNTGTDVFDNLGSADPATGRRRSSPETEGARCTEISSAMPPRP